MVKSMKVPTGYVLQESDYPEVPPKPGQLGRWKRYTDPIVQDITIHAEYGNPIPGAPTDPPSLMSTGEEPYSSGTAQPISTVTEEHSYIYASGMLLRETITSGSTTRTLDFRYDNVGYPYALIYNNGSSTATYYYITNLQGDVMYLVDSNGNQVAAYTYDPYGKILSATGTMAEINPLRYRGYYYDSETGFYYLQSRYYDPNTCRFINADSYASTGQSYLGYNMFAYCGNNPINFIDYAGESSIGASIGYIFLSVSLVIVAAITGATVITYGIAGLERYDKIGKSAVETFDNAIRSTDIPTTIANQLTETADDIKQKISDSFARVKVRKQYRSDGEWHHMVAQGSANAAQARQILNELEIDINGPINMIYIKTGLHRRIHNQLYYSWANTIIISAYSSAQGNKARQKVNVVNALDIIRSYIRILDDAAPY